MEYLKTTLHFYVHIHTLNSAFSGQIAQANRVYASILIPAESTLIKSKNMPHKK